MVKTEIFIKYIHFGLNVINPNYIGTHLMAVTSFRDDYMAVAYPSTEDFNRYLSAQLSVLGDELKVLKTFENINVKTAFPIVDKAVQDLRKGVTVDLEKLLE